MRDREDEYSRAQDGQGERRHCAEPGPRLIL
jgi:hypothetical protein